MKLIRTHKLYIFPLVLILLLIFLTATRISGSSVPVYSMLDGVIEEDDALIAHFPRGVRSDEWLVTTQLTIAQSAAGYPRINENIANGQNMSFQDLPYKSWFTAFAPQNIAFFALPLEYAFAFKWWLMAVLLAVAVYLLCIKLFSGKVLISALLSLVVVCSPMIVWWWQSATLLTVAYSLLCVWLTMCLVEAQTRGRRLLISALLFYFLTAFGLVLYPPFQIICLIIALAVFAAWFIDAYPAGKRLQALRVAVPYFVLAALFCAAVIALFYQANREDVQAILNTVYPGTRVEKGGGLSPLHAFGSFLSPILQSDTRSVGYLRNQSEASSFIFLAAYLVIPCIYLGIRQYKRTRTFPWPLALINVTLLAFLVRAHFSADFHQPIARLLLLDKIPTARLLMGIGLAGVFQLIFLIREVTRQGLGRYERLWLAVITGGVAFIATLLVGRHVAELYPTLLPDLSIAVKLSLALSVVVALLAAGKWHVGLIGLIVFSLVSTYSIHPLYRGLGAVTNSPVLTSIAKYPDDGAWVVLDDRLMINFPIMAGKKSVNSIHYYPQLDLWTELDPEGRDITAYNRFAHVVFSPDVSETFLLKHADMIVVKFDPCSEFVGRNVKYVLSPSILESSCVKSLETTGTPVRMFYVYEVVPAV